MIKFVEEKEGLGFAEAVELLADRYGVELEREQEDPRAEARAPAAARGSRSCSTARRPSTPATSGTPTEAAKARDYLAGRGLGEEVLRGFGGRLRAERLGPGAAARPAGRLQVDELRGVGLVQQGRQGGEYDRFRSRIMFPIRDRRGRALGFGGRAMRSDQGAKYVNTPETDFFHKSRMLYGIDRAKAAIAKAGRAVVVEGYTDVLALHQAGVEEAVGVMGTAITDEQVAALSGMVEEVVLALDADSRRAGGDAAGAAGRRRAKRMRLRVAAMPAGEDPAEMMAAGPAERFAALVDGAVELPAFQVGLGARPHRPRLAGRARPGARRGGAGAGGDGRVDSPRRAGAPRRRAPRRRPGLVLRRLEREGRGAGVDRARDGIPDASARSRRRRLAAARGNGSASAHRARASRARAAGDVRHLAEPTGASSSRG